MRTKKFVLAASLLIALAFIIPIEHKYDKLFRFFSLSLIPDGLVVPKYYDKKIYFYISDLIALLLLGLALFWLKVPWKKFFLEKGSLFLWIILGCSIGSIAASPFAHYPLPYVRLLQLLTPILLVSFIRSAFSEEERKKLTEWILISLVAAALIQAGIAIAQYFHQESLGLRLFGEQRIGHGKSPAIEVPGGSRWLLDTLFHRVSDTVTVIRSSGTMPHPNVLGGLLALSLLATYSLIHRFRILLYTLPIQFFALCTTYSRSALFGWSLGTLAWIFLNRPAPRYLKTMILFSVAASSILLFNQFVHRGGIVNYNEAAQKGDSIRIAQQNIALKMIKTHPLLGIGFSQFSARSPEYFPPRIDSETAKTGAHNIFLFLASETGLISLAAFLLFLSTLSRTDPSLTPILILFLFVGCCDLYPIVFQQGRLLFFLIGGLALPALAVNPSRKESWKIFDRISGSYDQINRIVSFGQDRSWRKKCSAYLPPNGKLLDLATGTGDQIIACLDKVETAIGIDLSFEMLEIAKKKISAPNVEFKIGDAEKIPFPDAQFDAATFSFGIRNVTDPLTSFKEIFRVLKPRGRCLILEFSLPPKIIRPFYLFYLRHILPRIGGWISKDPHAYQYLNQTIETFPSGKEFCFLMEKGGFRVIDRKTMALGAVSLYVGEKL